MNHRAKGLGPSENSRNSETVIAIEANDFAGANGKTNESQPNKAVIEDEAAKMVREETCSSFSIDVDCDDFVEENQRLCRICHLSAKESSKSVELIELGCGCKDELGVCPFALHRSLV